MSGWHGTEGARRRAAARARYERVCARLDRIAASGGGRMRDLERAVLAEARLAERIDHEDAALAARWERAGRRAGRRAVPLTQGA